MASALSLAEALATATELTLARWGGIVRLATLDGVHYTATVIDPDDYAPIDEAPVGAARSDVGAVEMLLDVVYGLNVDDVLGEFAAAFPAGITFSLTDDAAPVVDRATGDVIVPRELCDICHERPVTLSPERAPYRYGCDACNDSVAPALAGGA